MIQEIGSESFPSLSPVQVQICQLAQQFTTRNNSSVEQKLKSSNWRDIYAIISNPQIDNHVKIVCCSVLKWLIYHKKFVDNPLQLFNKLCDFYTLDMREENNKKIHKSQEIIQIVIQVIPTSYLRQKQKLNLIMSLINMMPSSPEKSPRLLKICQILIQTVDVSQLNNQSIVGELLLYFQLFLTQSHNPLLKVQVLREGLKCIQLIIDLINNQDLQTSNNVEQFLIRSTLGKDILQKIIVDSSQGKQIMVASQPINQLKLKALQIYSTIWVYYAEEHIFKLCLNSILNRPKTLYDEQIQIMEKIIVIIERSITQQAYYQYLHQCTQPIVINLFDLLIPKQSTKSLSETDPDQYVEILHDFCMQQQREILDVRIGSLLSSLCLYIDGYMTIVGTLCVMVLKNYNGTLQNISEGSDYMDIINKIWECSLEDKVSVCVIVLCAISDQLEKRQDLIRPLRVQLAGMTHIFKYPNCRIQPYLMCRFMMLYSFIAFPKCLDVFLPYLQTNPLYRIQLQSCYKILQRYYSKYPQFKSYLSQIGPTIIVSDHLTSLLETTIISGQISQEMEYKILQKLIIWIEQGMEKKNNAIGNKLSNLISMLFERMKVQDYSLTEQTVFAYIKPLIQSVTKPNNHDYSQFIVEICISFVKRFPSLQRSYDKLGLLMQTGFVITQKNNGIYGNCLDLFVQLTRYLPFDMVNSLIHIYMGCLESQDRYQDIWESFFGLEACMIRVGQLNEKVPILNFESFLNKIKSFQSELLQLKGYMFLLSVILADVDSRSVLQNYLYLQEFPPKFKSIPPLENKPYLLYYLLLAPSLCINLQSTYRLLMLILQLINRQQKLKQQIKDYQAEIYENMQQYHELTINSYGIESKITHPLLLKQYDIYNQFRKCWDKFPNKDQLMKVLREQERSLVLQLCTKATVGTKIRKIVKVRKDMQMNQMQ